jgi:hypothetical protein
MMAVVLSTTLKIDDKIVPEDTPVGKLTKKERDLAKELNLLEDKPDPEEEEAEEGEAEDSEDSSDDDSEGDGEGNEEG